MKTPAVKSIFAAAAAVVLAATPLVGQCVTIDITKVQQRYPWNGLVDIDYTITDDGTGKPGPDDNLELIFVDKSVSPVVTNRAVRFLQAPLPLTPGRHRITWDANGDGVTCQTDKGQFEVSIERYAPIYMVIDVSGGPSTNCYPVTYMNGEPAGGFTNDTYRGSKIVLRRIHPGSYMAGSPTNEANRGANEAQHRVALSKPFYIGVFEITQKQYKNVMNNEPTEQSYKGDYHPVGNLNYTTIRGGTWPNGNPAANTFMSTLRQKCKEADDDGNYEKPVTGFDLPTEFQWEYACRAGTTGAFNTTNDYANTTEGQEEQMNLLGRYKGDVSDARGGLSETVTTVGSYLPNQWGLYDMHGNVWEWCLDWYAVDASAQDVDPVGPDAAADNKSERVRRGGSCKGEAHQCRSAFRTKSDQNGNMGSGSGNVGFRLARTLP